VLIVDDRWEDNFLLQRLLRVAKVPHPVHTAGGGQEAIEVLQLSISDSTRQIPFLVFLDAKMPGRSGFEVLQWIREHAVLRNIAVVMLSDSDNPSEVQTAYDLGAQSYLAKYPSSQTLGEIVSLAALPLHLRGNFPKVTPDDGWPWNQSLSR
jgi:CheY-like chemotaxis protein